MMGCKPREIVSSRIARDFLFSVSYGDFYLACVSSRKRGDGSVTVTPGSAFWSEFLAAFPSAFDTSQHELNVA
jgi:hypothetical protein